MKKQITILAMLLLIAAVYSCKRDKTTEEPPAQTDHYTSTANFFAVNAPAMQTFTVNAATGGSFTTPKGTIVTVPANAFMTQTGGAVSGNVTIQFKDVYKKSDMLLSKLTTHLIGGGPMESAGMFYIKATQGANVLVMNYNKNITVFLPLNVNPMNYQMQPYVYLSNATSPGWVAPPVDSTGIKDSLTFGSEGYIFDLFYFNPPTDSGTWANCDHPIYNGFPMTTINLHFLDSYTDYHPWLFLYFNAINATINLYNNGNDAAYSYSPIGEPCTLVAVGVKDGKLYASFTPITISSNMTVNYSVTETTTEAFIAHLATLN